MNLTAIAIFGPSILLAFLNPDEMLPIIGCFTVVYCILYYFLDRWTNKKKSKK